MSTSCWRAHLESNDGDSGCRSLHGCLAFSAGHGKHARMSLGQIVAQNFRMVRKQRKLSQQAVAKKARVSVSYVSMLERGQRTPPLITLEAMAKALDVSPLYLLQELSTEKPRSRRR